MYEKNGFIQNNYVDSSNKILFNYIWKKLTEIIVWGYTKNIQSKMFIVYVI